jgi:hypothetical protein
MNIVIDEIVDREDGGADITFTVGDDETAQHLMGDGALFMLIKGVYNLNNREVMEALGEYVKQRS